MIIIKCLVIFTKLTDLRARVIIKISVSPNLLTIIGFIGNIEKDNIIMLEQIPCCYCN